MKHEDFEQYVKGLPVYYRLVFIHGERLFIRDEDCYRITGIQMAYEIYVRLRNRSELLSIEIDTTALGDGEPKSISIPTPKAPAPTSLAAGGLIPVPPLVPCPPLDLKYSEIDDHDDALTDGQVWIAIGIIILIILIISFCAFPSP